MRERRSSAAFGRGHEHETVDKMSLTVCWTDSFFDGFAFMPAAGEAGRRRSRRRRPTRVWCRTGIRGIRV